MWANLHFKTNNNKAQAGNEWSNIPPKSSQAKKKPPPPPSWCATKMSRRERGGKGEREKKQDVQRDKDTCSFTGPVFSAQHTNDTKHTNRPNKSPTHLLHLGRWVDQLHVHVLLLDVHHFGKDGSLLAVGHVDDGRRRGQEVHGGRALNGSATHSHQHQQLWVG